MNNTIWVGLEIGSALFSILFSLLLMKEKTIGWIFGIIASFMGVAIFYHSKIYAQSLISIYYAGIGIYGYFFWKNAQKKELNIRVWTIKQHGFYLLIFTFLSLISAYLFKQYTDSSSPYLDSFLTLFGFLASFKEARKILTGWVYWFVINAVSVILFYDQQLYYYSALMVVYAIICIPGYLNWRKTYLQKLEKNIISL